MLAAILRPGNAGANNADDHLRVFEHAVCEPKRLRYRLLHVAGKLTRHARRLTLHLPADWPWAAAVAKAFKRLAALPA